MDFLPPGYLEPPIDHGLTVDNNAANLEPSQALAAFDAALDQLIHSATDPLSGLLSLNHAVQTTFLRGFERARNRMAQVDHAIVLASETTGLPDHHAMRSTAIVLQSLLNLSAHVAHARVRAAEQLSTDLSPTGEVLPAKRPLLAGAVADGLVTPTQIDQILRGLTRLDKMADITSEQRSHAEQVLTAHAGLLPPVELGRLVERIRDHIDPDGILHDHEYHDATRRVEWHVTADGSLRVEGKLTPVAGQKLRAVLEPLSRLNDSTDLPDTRSLEQRRHDALETVLDRILRAGDVPSTGGTPATVAVTIDHDDLVNRIGHGRCVDGTTMPTATLLRMADEATIIPTVLSSSGAVLEQGRSNRLANLAQSWALFVRDGGCTFPGCSTPPEWCQRHHVVAWIDGGDTNLDNLTLLCHYHHANFDRFGWSCRMVDGLPWWTPPRGKDPDQAPRLHIRLQRMRT